MARPNTVSKRPPVQELPSAPAGAYAEVGDLLGVVVDHERRRGRGAQSNASGRYEPLARIAFDDGWRSLDELPPFKTQVTVDATRKIITRNDSPDIGFDRSINPYRGCEHGCIYCFARPTHAYLGLSPGLDFESKLFVKPEAADLLGKGTGGAELPAQGDRHRHQYRPLPADRPALPGDAPHPGSARARRPPGRHRHQVGAGAARSRHSGAHGDTQSGQGGAVGDHARRRARAQDGAARGDAHAAAGDAAAACAKPACRQASWWRR